MMGTTGPCVHVCTNHSNVSFLRSLDKSGDKTKPRLNKKPRYFYCFARASILPGASAAIMTSTKIFDFCHPHCISILLCLQRASAEDWSKIGHERSILCSWHMEFDT